MGTLRKGLQRELASSGAGGVGCVVAVNFGSSFTDYAVVNVSGQTWVEAGMAISVSPYSDAEDAIETVLLDFRTAVGDLVAGDGFTLHVFTPVEARGTYYFSCVGGTS